MKEALWDIVDNIPGFHMQVEKLDNQATHGKTANSPGVSGARADGGTQSSSNGSYM